MFGMPSSFYPLGSPDVFPSSTASVRSRARCRRKASLVSPQVMDPMGTNKDQRDFEVLPASAIFNGLHISFKAISEKRHVWHGLETLQMLSQT